MALKLLKLQKNEANIEISARLKKARIALGMTLSEFGEKIGLARSSLSQMETGERSVSVRTAYIIQAKIPKINTEWLLTGKGEMFLPEANAFPIPEPGTINDPAQAAAWDRVRVLERENRELLETVMRLVKIMEDKNNNKDV